MTALQGRHGTYPRSTSGTGRLSKSGKSILRGLPGKCGESRELRRAHREQRDDYRHVYDCRDSQDDSAPGWLRTAVTAL